MTRLVVTGPTLVAPGEAAHYTASAEYADGSSEDVTTRVGWYVPDDAISSGAGVFTFVTVGQAFVNAHFQGRGGGIRLLVLHPGTFRIQGTVTEADGNRLDGAVVEVVSGPGEGLRAETWRGDYVLYGVGARVRLRASAGGFAARETEINVTGNDAWEPFVLTRVAAPAAVSGLWSMTVSPSPGCRAGLPAVVSQRTYQIELKQADLQLLGTISGPTLRITDRNVYGSVLGSQVRLVFPGDTDYGLWSYPSVVDVFSTTESFGFSGIVYGVVGDSEIRGRLSGDFTYWDVSRPAANHEPNWYCRAEDHVVTLRR